MKRDDERTSQELSSLSNSFNPSRSSSVGESDASRHFGAKIRVNMVSQGLYLVIGRHNVPFDLLHRQGAQVLFALSGNKLLALMPVIVYLGLRKHPDIEFIGPVALDRQRFNRFLRLAHSDTNGNGAPGNGV